MNNPIFQNYKSRVLYASVWMLIISIQTLIFRFLSEQPFIYCLLDSFIYNGLFACSTIPLWYTVRFNKLESKAWYYYLAAHLLLAGIIISICLLAGYAIMYIITLGNNSYMHFLTGTTPWRIIEGLFFYVVTILTYYLYTYVEKLKEKASNEIRLHEIIKDSELNLLKSQINPHFLFNSLNSVSSLIVTNPQKAQTMLIELSDYLRYIVVSTNQKKMSLQKETENIERYLSIEKLRFGEKLIYEINISPDCSDLNIPAMILQPLFENAIKHGVYESTQVVNIELKAVKDRNYLHIEIKNNFDPESSVPKRGSGTGLKNIRERLRLTYGLSASLGTKIENACYIAALQIPLTTEN